MVDVTSITGPTQARARLSRSPQHVRRYAQVLAGALIVTVAAIAMVGCDGVGEKYVPVADENNLYFYPLEPGETARFLHQHREFNPVFGVNYETRAILEWTVTDTSRDEDGIKRITIKETLRGRSEELQPDGTVEADTIIVDATRHAIFTEDRLVFPPYTDFVDSWHWSYSLETPDTVWIDVFMGGTLDYTRSKKVTVVKDLGLYEWYSGTAGAWEDWDLLKRIVE